MGAGRGSGKSSCHVVTIVVALLLRGSIQVASARGIMFGDSVFLVILCCYYIDYFSFVSIVAGDRTGSLVDFYWICSAGKVVIRVLVDTRWRRRQYFFNGAI